MDVRQIFFWLTESPEKILLSIFLPGFVVDAMDFVASRGGAHGWVEVYSAETRFAGKAGEGEAEAEYEEDKHKNNTNDTLPIIDGCFRLPRDGPLA